MAWIASRLGPHDAVVELAEHPAVAVPSVIRRDTAAGEWMERMADERNRTMAVDPTGIDEVVASTPFARGDRASALVAILPLVLPPPAEAEAEPVAVSAAVVPFRLGDAWHLTVVAKLSFAITRGADGARLVAASHPEPIRPRDVHRKNQPLGRVIAPADRAPYKPRVDVTVVGHAHAPGGQPVRTMDARVALTQHGETPLDKTVRVVGPRARADDEPEPFSSMAVGWDRAFGGVETPANPIGTGEDAGEEQPNIVDPREPRRPAGFGPLAPGWPARARQLAGVPRRLVDAAVPELPTSFEWAYFQHAPADQRIPTLAPAAQLRLEGFDPDFPVLVATLPTPALVGAVYGLFADRIDEGAALAFHLDGLHVDTDRWICEVVGRATLPLADDVDPKRLLVAVGGSVGGATIALPVRRPAEAYAPDGADGAPRPRGRRAATVLWEEAAKAQTLTIPSEEPAGPALPFGARAPAPAAAPPGSPSAERAPPSSPWAGGPPRPASSPAARGPAPSTWARPVAVSGPPASPPVAVAPPGPPPTSGSAASVPDPITLEVHAAVTVELEEPGARRADVLASHRLAAEEYAVAARAFRDELRKELRRGEHALRDRFDDAWVRAWEALHPDLFTIDDLARLEVAERRGTLLLAIEELGLEPATALRLRRVWRRRMAADVRLRAELERAVAALR